MEKGRTKIGQEMKNKYIINGMSRCLSRTAFNVVGGRRLLLISQGYH